MSRKWLWIVLVPAIISGCSSKQNQQILSSVPGGTELFGFRVQDEKALAESVPCCTSLSEINYLATPESYFFKESVSSGNQSFEFASGKSFLLAYEIPQGSTDLPVTVTSEIKQSVFVPKVAMLNENFEVTRVVPGENFDYLEKTQYQPHRLLASFNLRRTGSPETNEKYLLVYTTDELVAGTSNVSHVATLESRSTSGMNTTGLKDPIIPHATQGVVGVHFGRGGRALDDSKVIVANTSELVDPSRPVLVAAPVAAETVAPATKPAAEPAAATQTTSPKAKSTVATGSMLEETEAFYNQLIQKYVAQGDLNRALTLVEEAEAAGSASARSTFIKAYSNY
ncbi:MalM family protein [Aliagarivorans taiwanensis]|uniref:MalM family protein n=1 Tax=Aliagarivorans taiwanensis TaxID=561966 RepID=UPI0003F63ECC|nr:MalM family protein [Aliagarivorans taiwanensis]